MAADGNGLERSQVIDVELVGEVGGLTSSSPVATALRDDEAEKAVLAAALLDGSNEFGMWRRLSAVLAARHFSDPRHATLWQAFAAVHARGEPLDILTASAELRARRRLETVGGMRYLGELTEYIPTLAHCETHARIVLKAAVRRELAAIGSRIVLAAEDPSRDPATLRELAIEALRRVHIGSAQASSAEDLAAMMMQAIEDGIEGKALGPLPFGVPTLDRMSGGGMKRGGNYYLAARPGIGKTALVCQVAGATAEAGERVLYVALEPSKLDVIQSITANRAKVALTKITRAHRELSRNDMDAITLVANRLLSWPLHVVDASARDCPDTVAKVEGVMRSLPSLPSLVVIDHLLELKPTARYGKSHEGTAEVISALASLGKRTGATILTLCHIGRGVSSSNSTLYRRPRAEDIAGGDALNRVADGIILVHREDKYPTRKENVGNPLLAGHVDLLAPKLRGVEDNTMGRMIFRGDVQRFDAIGSEQGRGGDSDDFPHEGSYGNAE